MIRQAIKCCFWCITVPVFLVFSIAVPILAFMLWVWASDDDESLKEIFLREFHSYVRGMSTLIIT